METAPRTRKYELSEISSPQKPPTEPKTEIQRLNAEFSSIRQKTKGKGANSCAQEGSPLMLKLICTTSKKQRTQVCACSICTAGSGVIRQPRRSQNQGGCGVHLIYRLKEVASFQWCEDVDGQDVVTSKNGSREWMCSGVTRDD